eukprot:74116_1
MAMDCTTDNKEPPAMDEDLYSRQLYVLGHDAMRKMQSANVLIVGMNGLGVEIAKNVILAGVKSVGILDGNLVQIRDLSAQFYLKESDVGSPRAQATVGSLRELNRYVPVSVVDEPLSVELVERSDFQVIVLVDVPLATQLAIDAVCRRLGHKLVAADVNGVAGEIFVDFGENFVVTDVNGEQPLSGIISHVSQDGLVTVLDESRHGLETGDFVLLDELEGMDQANGREFRVEVSGPYTFTVGDVRGLGTYTGGGRFDQVKKPKTFSFKSLSDSLASPDLMISDFAKLDRPAQLHCLYGGLAEFRRLQGRLPVPNRSEEAKQVTELAVQFGKKLKESVVLDEKLIFRLARCSASVLPPMAAALGGIAAQEVLKACSGKFAPIRGHFYFDAAECLPENELLPEEFEPTGSRYDDQIAVFGKETCRKIQELRLFLVGAGAIGCEMLKNWAMIGAGCSPSGLVHVTDMDCIEKSNLNRQFLFRSSDVGQMKSETAARAVRRMNGAMNVESASNRVGPASESVYNDDFWSNLSGVCTALDNVEARLYVDQQCVYHQKPMLESGTLGTKGNTQVIVPHLTESYGSSRDPPEHSIPLCTLKSFPNKIEHTIQFARDQFEGWFVTAPEDVNRYLSEPNYLKELSGQQINELESLHNIRSYLLDDKPVSFEQCVEWARLKFEEEYSHQIQQLLFNFPKDTLTASGAKFWSGSKRAPSHINFDINDPTHMDYIFAAANLRAFTYGLSGNTNRDFFRCILKKVKVPEFVPKRGIKIAVNDEELKNQSEAAQNGFSADDELSELRSSLPQPSSLAGYRLAPSEFEKDDASNHHVAFVTAAANLRARNYTIREVTRHECKRIAGKIIPAIATTTAMVAGLICLELYKIVQNKPLDQFKNAFANLAIPMITLSEPMKPVTTTSKVKGGDFEFSLWDRIDIDDGDITLQQFLDFFQEKYGLEVNMLSCGAAILYSFFMPPAKATLRKTMSLSKVVETVTKTALRPDQRFLVLEACVNDENDEDIEIPYIRVKFR